MKKILIASFLFITASCSSTIARNSGSVKYYPKTYPGIKMDYNIITHSSGKTFEFMLQIGPIIDFPFSLVLDTLLFPYDYQALKDSEKSKEKDRVKNE